MDSFDDSPARPSDSAMEDRAVVRRVLAGEREAFRVLVEKYQKRVFHGALRILRDPDEAEDAAQESFLKAFKNLGRYDARWAFSTWLLTIATRTALNVARARGRARGQLSVDDRGVGERLATPEPGPAERSLRNEWKERLRQEIHALGERMRVIFGLRYEDDLSIREIAHATSSSEASVKVILHRARKTLRQRLKEFSDLA